MSAPIDNEQKPVTFAEVVSVFLALAWLLIGAAVCVSFCGCASYKGGKVVDGSNIAIGITIPGTEWTINALDYVGGLRVCGNDATAIIVTNEVCESNSYFGVISTQRRTKMAARIEPTESAGNDDLDGGGDAR